MTALTRRQLLVGGSAAVVAAGAGGVGLVVNDVLPGHHIVNRLLGRCSVDGPPPPVGEPRPTVSGQFTSRARGRTVAYAVAYPPGHGPGDRLPLVVVLHAHGGNHGSALSGLRPGGVALVAADGGNGYWHAHPGDDPMAMVVDELIPLCRARGLDAGLAVMGTSMGGYGALLLAERHPGLVRAVAAVSPAVWTSWAQAKGANDGAFDSAADFAVNDVIANAGALSGTAVRVACGVSDPFIGGVRALAAALPPGAVVETSKGCHTDEFFNAAEPASLSFLADHLR